MRAYLSTVLARRSCCWFLAYVVIAFILPVLPGSAVVAEELRVCSTWRPSGRDPDLGERTRKSAGQVQGAAADVLIKPRLKVVRPALLRPPSP